LIIGLSASKHEGLGFTIGQKLIEFTTKAVPWNVVDQSDTTLKLTVFSCGISVLSTYLSTKITFMVYVPSWRGSIQPCRSYGQIVLHLPFYLPIVAVKRPL